MKKSVFIGALVFLSGCSTPPPPVVVVSKPAFKRPVSQMETAGIQVIQRGDRLTLVIPTDVYFVPMTTTVKEERQTDLRQMARFTKTFADKYPNSVIKVTGYTDQVFSQRNQLTLAQSYASIVSSYLFNVGIDPRRIATQSRGGNEPIAEMSKPSSAAQNRRVVVQVN